MGVPKILQSPRGQTPDPRKPQPHPLLKPDTRTSRALLPEVDLIQSTTDVSAHFVMPPARFRADPAGQLDTDPTYLACPAKSRQATTMATMQLASRPGLYCARPEHQPDPTRPGRANEARSKRSEKACVGWVGKFMD
ncbi:Hypothetical predicted protein [Lynx pardinus]|uniref:Uncharacterized protein n=1 Tax=Lynx pardinus TaxID=191816 RepID=A0A485NSZ0_LYNPA|nr:Hypothetical predicted protein [Lynx pardinus]